MVDRSYPGGSPALKRGGNEMATVAGCILLFQMPRAEALGFSFETSQLAVSDFDVHFVAEFTDLVYGNIVFAGDHEGCGAVEAFFSGGFPDDVFQLIVLHGYHSRL